LIRSKSEDEDEEKEKNTWSDWKNIGEKMKRKGVLVGF